MCLWPAGSDWGHDPERFFGHVTVRVDPGEEDTPRSRSGPGDNDLHSDDDDYSEDNISGVSGSYEDNDEVPFGPSRVAAGDGKGQSKSLEILRRAGSLSHHPGVDIEQGTLTSCCASTHGRSGHRALITSLQCYDGRPVPHQGVCTWCAS